MRSATRALLRHYAALAPREAHFSAGRQAKMVPEARADDEAMPFH